MQEFTTKFWLHLLSAKARMDDERGATAVEYGLIVALIAAVIVATVALLGGEVLEGFQAVLTALTP